MMRTGDAASPVVECHELLSFAPRFLENTPNFLDSLASFGNFTRFVEMFAVGLFLHLGMRGLPPQGKTGGRLMIASSKDAFGLFDWGAALSPRNHHVLVRDEVSKRGSINELRPVGTQRLARRRFERHAHRIRAVEP